MMANIGDVQQAKNELRLFLTELAVDPGSSNCNVSPIADLAFVTSVFTAVDISSKSRLTASRTDTDCATDQTKSRKKENVC